MPIKDQHSLVCFILGLQSCLLYFPIHKPDKSQPPLMSSRLRPSSAQTGQHLYNKIHFLSEKKRQLKPCLLFNFADWGLRDGPGIPLTFIAWVCSKIFPYFPLGHPMMYSSLLSKNKDTWGQLFYVISPCTSSLFSISLTENWTLWKEYENSPSWLCHRRAQVALIRQNKQSPLFNDTNFIAAV